MTQATRTPVKRLKQIFTQVPAKKNSGCSKIRVSKQNNLVAPQNAVGQMKQNQKPVPAKQKKLQFQQKRHEQLETLVNV